MKKVKEIGGHHKKENTFENLYTDFSTILGGGNFEKKGWGNFEKSSNKEILKINFVWTSFSELSSSKSDFCAQRHVRRQQIN